MGRYHRRRHPLAGLVMARGPLTFRQHDLERALRAARRAGGGRVKIERDGSITVVLGEEADRVPAADVAEANEWDDAGAAL
jgi:hypothetical protein